MALLRLLNLIASFVIIGIIGHTSALRPGGRNVCSRTERYVAYEVRRYVKTRTEGYRTCCKKVWGACIDRCTRHRTRSYVEYKTISHIRYRPIYFCCNGWAQTGSECTRPICLTPCNHGDCVAPNTCRCHNGFEGSYCRSDINECKRMGLPDGFVPTTSKISTVFKTSTRPPTQPPSQSKSSYKISSTTKAKISSSSFTQITQSSSVIEVSSSVPPVKSSISPKETHSSVISQMSSSILPTSSKLRTHLSVTSSSLPSSVALQNSSSIAASSPIIHSSSFTTNSLLSKSSSTSLLASVITTSTSASSTSSIATKKSNEVTSNPRTKSASSLSSSQSSFAVTQSSRLSSVSQSSVSEKLSSSSSHAIQSSSIYSSVKLSQHKSASSTPILISSPTVTKISHSSQSVASTNTQVTDHISILPSSSLFLASSSIGLEGSGLSSGLGSGIGSGLGSGEDTEWLDFQDNNGEGHDGVAVARKRREVEVKSLPVKSYHDNAPSYNPAPISYPYRCTHMCSNTVGSFKCKCYNGYYLDSDKKTCRDIDECAKGNGGCSHRCVNTVGSYKCECPHPALYLWRDRHTCKAHGMSLICTKDYMQVNFEKKLLRGLDVHHLRLTDSSCKGWANSTHLMLRTELDKCGTTYEEKGDVEVYRNAVVNRDITIGNIITRIRGIRVPFQCTYTRAAHVSGVGIQPDRHRLTFTEDGFGQFTFTMSMFHGASYHTRYSHHQYPIHVKLRDRIYFEVNVVSEDANLIIFAERCMATPYLQRGKGPEYVFLENGCAKDSTLSYSVYGSSAYQRFSLEAFRFLDDVPNVYFHCDVIACHKNNKHSRCYQGCQPSKKRHARDVSNKKETNTYNIAEGPLSLADYQPIGKDEKNAAFHFPQFSLFIAGIACTALLVGSVQVVKHLRSKTRRGYQPVPVHERMD